MSTSFFNKFSQRAHELYPGLSKAARTLNPDHLISPYTVPIKKSSYEMIEKFVSIIYQTSRNKTYRQLIDSQDDAILNFHPPQAAVLMAYDFHLDQEGRPRLIEINTNASGFLISDILYKTDFDSTDRAQHPWNQAISDLKQSFFDEIHSLDIHHISCAIIDETLEKQKMLIEFYLYQELFTSWGWHATLNDFAELKYTDQKLSRSDGSLVNFIYNRYNDFYLQRPESHNLRAAYLDQSTILSPHPLEYLLLADKKRLIEWTRTEFQQKLGFDESARHLINQVLLKSYEVSDFESLEDLWKQRRKFFFKPLRSYGSKSAFKGANISRRMFDEVFSTQECFAQELCPAPQWTSPDGQIWKYDLRFYVYRDKIQLGVGRLYQGQVTNFKIDASGFCRLSLV